MNVTVKLSSRLCKYKYLIITGRSAVNIVLMILLVADNHCSLADYDELHQHYLLIFLGWSLSLPSDQRPLTTELNNKRRIAWLGPSTRCVCSLYRTVGNTVVQGVLLDSVPHSGKHRGAGGYICHLALEKEMSLLKSFGHKLANNLPLAEFLEIDFHSIK